MRGRFQDFWYNIGEIPNIYNSLLQLKVEKTAVSAWRLVLNTTVGIGRPGVLDGRCRGALTCRLFRTVPVQEVTHGLARPA